MKLQHSKNCLTYRHEYENNHVISQGLPLKSPYDINTRVIKILEWESNVF